jgi:hypothetical protein
MVPHPHHGSALELGPSVQWDCRRSSDHPRRIHSIRRAIPALPPRNPPAVAPHVTHKAAPRAAPSQRQDPCEGGGCRGGGPGCTGTQAQGPSPFGHGAGRQAARTATAPHVARGGAWRRAMRGTLVGRVRRAATDETRRNRCAAPVDTGGRCAINSSPESGGLRGSTSLLELNSQLSLCFQCLL